LETENEVIQTRRRMSAENFITVHLKEELQTA
jgi:hypothetical protein